MKNKNIGRPSKINETVIIKLEHAFNSNFDVVKACKYAGFSRNTYYRHLSNDEFFAQRMRQAKATFNPKVLSGL